MSDYEVRYGEYRGIDEENRTADFVISSNAKDRHGTVVNMANWKLGNYQKNGIVGYQHDVYGGDMCNKADPDDVIGRGEVFFEDGERANGEDSKLIGRVHFEDAETNPKADKIWRKVKAGTLRATSVGFIPIANGESEIGQYGYLNDKGERVDADTFYFHGQELLEFSIVNIPSNPEATAKALRGRTHNALLFIKEQLGQDYSFADIDELQVKDIREYLEKGIKPYRQHSGNEGNTETEESDEETEESKAEAEETSGREETEQLSKGRSRLLQIRQRELELIDEQNE